MMKVLLLTLSALLGQTESDRGFDKAVEESITAFKMPVWRKLSCSIEQMKSNWVISYRFQPVKNVRVLTIVDIKAYLPGYVSNSLIEKYHSVPRLSLVAKDKDYTVINGEKFDNTCTERLFVREPTTDAQGIVTIILELVHEHGDYKDLPLLSKRKLTLDLGLYRLNETIDMSSEQPGQNLDDFVENDNNFDDTRFISPPHSLYLTPAIPGGQYIRFGEVKVRQGETVQLSFFYYLSKPYDGVLKVRWAEYSESPNAWKVMSEHAFETILPCTHGYWKKYSKTVRVSGQTTTVAVDVCFAESDFGEAWIDDVHLLRKSNGKP
jgi:hypothetical protein